MIAMKIISKYKDYYDYLNGIWGIDDNIILDRTSFDNLTTREPTFKYEEYKFFICGKMISGYRLKGIDKILFGDDLIPFTYINKYNKKRFFKKEYLNVKYREESICLFLEDDLSYLNDKEGCPIIIKYYNILYKFPILSKFNFHRIIDAENIYKMLTDWLSKDDIIIKSISDKEKIELHGFDNKTSFRNM